MNIHVRLLKFHQRMSTDPLPQLQVNTYYFKFKEQEKVPQSQVIIKDYKSEFSGALFKLLVEREYLQRGAHRIDNLLNPPDKCLLIFPNKGNNNIRIY